MVLFKGSYMPEEVLGPAGRHQVGTLVARRECIIAAWLRDRGNRARNCGPGSDGGGREWLPLSEASEGVAARPDLRAMVGRGSEEFR